MIQQQPHPDLKLGNTRKNLCEKKCEVADLRADHNFPEEEPVTRVGRHTVSL